MTYPGLRILPSTVRPSDLEGQTLPTTNVDALGRRIDYLRISVTDRCNLRCVYCMPEEGVALQPKDELLSFEEIWRIVRAATEIGFRKFRVTGGEPLVVKGATKLIRGIREASEGALLCLTSNGILLADVIDEIHSLGVNRLNISLDTLDPSRFRALTRRDGLDKVLRTIDRGLELGFERIKVNAVIVPGVNEEDLLPLVGLAESRDIDIRFIEQMPLDGQDDGGFMGADEMLERISARYPLESVVPDDSRQAAQLMFRSPNLSGQVGIIAPRSRKFCANCNRMRLTSGGELKGCLLSEGTLDLKTPLREGLTDEELKKLLFYAIGIKPAEYKDERYGLDRSMSAIGG
ncbi:MAG: GTP 3',8-cyclase MoaA [Myxococcota bacterium]